MVSISPPACKQRPRASLLAPDVPRTAGLYYIPGELPGAPSCPPHPLPPSQGDLSPEILGRCHQSPPPPPLNPFGTLGEGHGGLHGSPPTVKCGHLPSRSSAAPKSLSPVQLTQGCSPAPSKAAIRGPLFASQQHKPQAGCGAVPSAALSLFCPKDPNSGDLASGWHF